MRKILSLLIIIGALSGCSKDFLETKDPNQITNDSYWTSESDVEFAIYGCYDALQQDGLYGGGPYAPNFRDHDCLSDNAYNAWGWNGLKFIADGSITSDHAVLLRYWNSNYRGIARVNQVIKNVPNIEVLDDEVKNSYIAEAKFLRALFYFNLVNTFGDVPLILSTQEIDDAHIAKSDKDLIYLEIIADLEYAVDNATIEQVGRAGRGAALGLLTRVYLYDGQFANAAETAAEVMAMGYGLYNDYTGLFSSASELSNEIVFSVRFESLLDGEGEKFSGTWAKNAQTHHQPMPNLVNDFYCTDGLPISESPLFDADDETMNRDPRLDVTILFGGEVWIDGGNPYNPKKSKTGYALQKYVRNTTENITDGDQDFYLIRYADILLMRAEALIENGELGQEVYDLINLVRQRVGMPTIEEVEGTGLSQDQLREILHHERRVELAAEGFRYYDLKRWGKLQEARETASNDPVNAVYTPVYQGEKSLYWPIPQVEVDNNTKLEQNPLWK